jgi:phenylpropionate dioxygenase-like ring-hydroxylating dioxygenase large terminal subunit
MLRQAQVHKNSKACVARYPSVVQNNILWLYPRAGAEHRDVLQRKRSPFIPEIDDPAFVTTFAIKDLHYGYASTHSEPLLLVQW